jgi:hypothetical protein
MYSDSLLCCQHSGTFRSWSQMTDELHSCIFVNMHDHAYSSFIVNSHRPLLRVCHSKPLDVRVNWRRLCIPLLQTISLAKIGGPSSPQNKRMYGRMASYNYAFTARNYKHFNHPLILTKLPETSENNFRPVVLVMGVYRRFFGHPRVLGKRISENPLPMIC